MAAVHYVVVVIRRDYVMVEVLVEVRTLHDQEEALVAVHVPHYLPGR